jgi:hypothetical protein
LESPLGKTAAVNEMPVRMDRNGFLEFCFARKTFGPANASTGRIPDRPGRLVAAVLNIRTISQILDTISLSLIPNALAETVGRFH